MVPQAFLNTGVISLDPLVTYSKRHTPAPLGLPGGVPELFRGRKSLHFVSPSWMLYGSDIKSIAETWQSTVQQLPSAKIFFLASTEQDVMTLSAAGVPTLPCNVSILLDETIYKPHSKMDFSDAAYDAIYNARFEPYKRHELAREIESLALIHDARFDGSESPYTKEILRTLPNARSINHEIGRGRYAPMDKEAVARAINKAHCGLALANVEGIMRASMENLLCGVPLVSTHCIGGRERYYQEPYVTVVPDDPVAIAEAVREMKRRKFNKLAVRDHIGRIVEFERWNFRNAVNGVARSHFGVKDLFRTLAPFIRADPFTEPRSPWSRRRLAPVAAALNVTLEPLEAVH